jgi:hypothetical protein
MNDFSIPLRVIYTEFAAERRQVRFPRSKKKRIRAKWAARPGNYRTEPRMFKAPGDVIICHPALKAQIDTAIAGSDAAQPAAGDASIYGDRSWLGLAVASPLGMTWIGPSLEYKPPSLSNEELRRALHARGIWP